MGSRRSRIVVRASRGRLPSAARATARPTPSELWVSGVEGDDGEGRAMREGLVIMKANMKVQMTLIMRERRDRRR